MSLGGRVIAYKDILKFFNNLDAKVIAIVRIMGRTKVILS